MIANSVVAHICPPITEYMRVMASSIVLRKQRLLLKSDLKSRHGRLMRTSPSLHHQFKYRRNFKFVAEEGKERRNSTLAFPLFSILVVFSLIFQSLFFYSLFAEFNFIVCIMMKFPGNWVKCAYTQKHCFFFLCCCCCSVFLSFPFFYHQMHFFVMFAVQLFIP